MNREQNDKLFYEIEKIWERKKKKLVIVWF